MITALFRRMNWIYIILPSATMVALSTALPYFGIIDNDTFPTGQVCMHGASSNHHRMVSPWSPHFAPVAYVAARGQVCVSMQTMLYAIISLASAITVRRRNELFYRRNFLMKRILVKSSHELELVKDRSQQLLLSLLPRPIVTR